MKTGRPGKKIMCVNDGRIYDSMSSAAEAYNTTRSTISKNMSGKLRTAKGMCFVSITGNETPTELEEIRKEVVIKKFNIEGVVT